MNYLITAAGNGARFCRAGIKPPKPLVRVKGRELLIWSLSSFPIGPEDCLYIITQEKHQVRKRLERLICFLYPDTSVYWLELKDVLEGQLLTVITAVQEFDIRGKLVIHNCDTYHDATKVDFDELLCPEKCFGVIPYFCGEGSHWSFVRPDPVDNKLAQEVREKVRISENCSVGTYAFSSAEKMLDLADAYITVHKHSHIGEFYVAPLYQFAIEMGERVAILESRSTRLFGTPEELIATFNISFYSLLSENSWDAHQRGTLIVDIDGTLCGGPVGGDYSLVQPMHEVCQALRNADRMGYYIVLFTARNMRTFRGSLGLINKYTAPVLLEWLKNHSIPYDEIYFGKPWGSNVGYIDDKAVKIDEFLLAHRDHPE